MRTIDVRFGPFLWCALPIALNNELLVSLTYRTRAQTKRSDKQQTYRLLLIFNDVLGPEVEKNNGKKKCLFWQPLRGQIFR